MTHTVCPRHTPHVNRSLPALWRVKDGGGALLLFCIFLCCVCILLPQKKKEALALAGDLSRPLKAGVRCALHSTMRAPPAGSQSPFLHFYFWTVSDVPRFSVQSSKSPTHWGFYKSAFLRFFLIFDFFSVFYGLFFIEILHSNPGHPLLKCLKQSPQGCHLPHACLLCGLSTTHPVSTHLKDKGGR